MTTPTTDKPVCGPSIEPLREWVKRLGYAFEPCTEAIAAYDAQAKELETSEMLVKGLEGNLAACEAELERHRDALKKAKVLLNDSQPPWPNPVFLAHTLENASWRYRRESLIATINALNL